jgi:hypothetical protein
MLPVEFEQCNFTFTKPSSMTDEECLPLRVFKGQDTTGVPVIISCWQFSKEDLEEIEKTGRVYLTICGTGMPPISLQTESPFEAPL